jgi:uracil-DNA glycosylase
MISSWEDMDYWRSTSWQKVQERLDELESKKVLYNPSRSDLFAALDATPFDRVHVAIFGQDPYPTHSHATGIAFSVPKGTSPLPATAHCLIQEYNRDLGLPHPGHFNLKHWCKRGVFLWNVIPSCEAGKPLSHDVWEWEGLTEEIILNLSEKKIVFCFLGAKARSYAKLVNTDKNYLIETSHPSPRGSLNSSKPFNGSRIFSRINECLCEKGLYPIHWRL